MKFLISIVLITLVTVLGEANILAKENVTDTQTGVTSFDLRWRELGPNRAGRTTAVAGVTNRPFTYYMGATGGGVWRTDNAGGDWYQLGVETFGTGSVGAVSVSQSSPDTLYVGLGEAPYRLYSSSYGDGIYRSDDGGKTWAHVGLSKSYQISAIAIHPETPEVVWVAVQGSPWGESIDRGVYKTSDGGRTWRKTLYVNAASGAVDVVTDPTDPNIVYATLWDHDYEPWYLGSGGQGSGVFRSNDGGESWKRIENGLPSGNIGKAGVTPAAGSPGTVWALLESAPETAGLYRSSDYGESWKLINPSGEIRTRPWYYTHIIADPVMPDTVYSLGQDAHKSTDGGKTFQRWAVAGYDYHALWINPENSDIIIIGSDGGASITVDGGASWSTTHNQPTAQLYRVSVDNQFPYNVYAAQQDNTSISISSRPYWGGYDTASPSNVGGGETGYIEPDPFNVDVVYGTTELGWLTRYNRRTNASTVIHAPLRFPEGIEPRDLQYRFSVNSPVLASKHTRCLLYHGAQVLLRSEDCGDTWDEISPDLTFNDASRQGKGGGPYTNEIINHFGAIASLSESPKTKDILWAASNDGSIAVTQNAGQSWQVVKQNALPEGSANSIDASPHRDGTAYVAVYSMPFNDYRAHAYRTDDFGTTWQSISAGLPVNTPVRVVREDPKVPGLLFVGTETGVHYSNNNGSSWQSLRLNMPAVPVTDIKFASNDIVISTQGRGIWVLHDISPLRQVLQTDTHVPYLMKPAPVYRVGGAGSHRARLENPAQLGSFYKYNFGETLPSGATIDFLLPENFSVQDSSLSLRVLTPQGDVVRSYKSADIEFKAGHNRVVWNLGGDVLPEIPRAWDSREIYPPAPVGSYIIQLQHNGQTLEAPLEVMPDPRDSSQQDKGSVRRKVVLATIGILKDLLSVGQAVEAMRACSVVGGKTDKAWLAELDVWQNKVADPRLTINNDRVNYGASFIFDLRVFLEFASNGEQSLNETYSLRLKELNQQWLQFKKQASELLKNQDCAA